MLPLTKPFPERWWYVPRERTNRQQFPHLLLTGDEFCNPTVLIQLPFLGDIVIRYKPGPIRTVGGCKKCVAAIGPWCEGCEHCHQGPRCHRWTECTDSGGHTSKLGTCPKYGGSYCSECDLYPEKQCPNTEEKT